MVSIRDVAREAGVAISTVSKVLNNYPNVSEKTRDRVNEVVRQMGFVPNALAATLSSKRSGRIALLLKLNMQTQAIDEIDMQYISGAIRKAQELQLDVITVFYSMICDMEQDELVNYFASQGIRGIIIYGMTTSDKQLHRLIKSGGFKIVAIDAPFVNDSTSSVSIDNSGAQYEVADKTLTENKCKSALYIAGSRSSYISDERLDGMKRLCADKNIGLLIRNGNFSELQARNITLKYAKGKDAVICASDLMAIGAMKALIDMDIFRPVCGFDGIILMGYVGKQMNTVRQDFAEISGEAVTEISRLMSGEAGRHIVIPHSLARIKYMDIIC